LDAIKQDPLNIIYIKPKNTLNYRALCLEAVGRSARIMDKVDKNHFISVYGSEGFATFLKLNLDAIKYVPNSLISEDVFVEKVKQDPSYLRKIDVMYQTVKICHTAVKADPNVLKFVKLPYELVFNYKGGVPTEVHYKFDSVSNIMTSTVFDMAELENISSSKFLGDEQISDDMWKRMIRFMVNPAILIKYAFKHNASRVIRLLIEAKAVQLDRPIKSGKQPIHYACKHEDVELVKLLIANGVNLDCATNNGSTPLHYVSNYKCVNEEIMRLLIKESVNVNLVCNDGYTPLLQLAENNDYDAGDDRIEAIKLMLGAGADPNIELVNAFNDPETSTALTLAASGNQIGTVELLIKAGANREYKDGSGKRAIDYAVEHQNMDMVKILVS
jgi:hypothetical protein